MKFTIKKYKFFNIGPEGGCFKCDLYIDGVLRAHVESSSTGGPTDYHWVKGGKVPKGECPTTMIMPADVKAFVDAQPEENHHGYMLKMDMDCLIEPAIQQFEFEQKIRKVCAKVMCVSCEGDAPDTYRKYKVPYSADLAADFKRRNPKGVIFNETLAA